MTSMDKTAIIFSIAITVIGVGIAASSSSGGLGSAPTSPIYPSDTIMDTKVTMEKEEAAMVEKEEAAMVEKEEAAMVEKEEAAMVEKEEEVMVEKEEEVMVEKEEEVMVEKEEAPQKHTIDIPAGTSVLGCEQTNVCYLPAEITINAGDTVEWINLDTTVHTVSGGSPAAGLSGVFDSNLIMIDATYEVTFDEAGSFDYFCKMHPWMTGSVTVN